MPTKLVMPRPNAKQDLAFRETRRQVAYGGARGGGKSWFVRWKATLLCFNYPGIKILITRRTYKELLNNHIEPLKAMLNGLAKYNASEKCFRFPNGSSIWFGYCACDADLGQYQGAEYDVWFCDEAGQFLESWITQIDACVRGVNGFPKRSYYTLNPGGPSHGYFKRVFVDRKFNDDENPDDYAFIQALCTDNDALMESQPEYLRALEKLPSKIRKAWLEGSWDIFEGQFFEDFRAYPDKKTCEDAGITQEAAYKQRRYTHVIEPFDINQGSCRNWPIMRSYDFGYAKPFSVGYWAVDYEGTLYRIMELYGCTSEPNEGVKWTPDEQFKAMAELENTHPWLKGRKIVDSVADPAIWDSSRGESIADTAARYGIYFSPGDNNRIPGWMQVHYRLQFDDNGYPRMYVFSNCKAFIRTMPLMMYSDTKPEDLNTDLEDHCPDEVRYMCMSRPIKPIIPAAEDPYLSNPMHTILNIPKGDLMPAPTIRRMEILDDGTGK